MSLDSRSLVLALIWTLWIRTQTTTSDTWNAAPGFPSQDKCEVSIKEKLNTWRQFNDAIFSGNSVTFTGNNSTIIYLCLPDNQDPRRTIRPNGPANEPPKKAPNSPLPPDGER